MGGLYSYLVRPALFRLDPESAHELGVGALRAVGQVAPLCRILERFARLGLPDRPVECFGLRFPHPVGLAAGFDKDGLCWPAAAALGFSHVEIGTVTFQRQPGNPRPRLFRLPRDGALINRLGFNNAGAEAVAARLARQASAGRRVVPLGINIGKSRAVNLEQAAEDYLATFRLVAPHADYVAVNVSSPNTPDLRRLQEETRLADLLRLLAGASREAAAKGGRRVPLLVKIAPDLTFRQLDAILETILALGLDGVIATNTTVARPPLLEPAAAEAGGLSGRPLGRRSTEIIRYIHLATGGRLPIVGVGGIGDVVDASEKLDAGARLLQVYTGWIYGGPFFAPRLARALARRETQALLAGRL